jgi:hypothetical protein
LRQLRSSDSHHAQKGAQLFVVTPGHNVVDEMREHAGLMLDLVG